MHFRFQLLPYLIAGLLLTSAGGATAAPHEDEAESRQKSDKESTKTIDYFVEESHATNGTVPMNGGAVPYQAIAGTLTVHPKDWDDVPRSTDKDDNQKLPDATEDSDKKNPRAQASMFYVGYFRHDPKGAPRPLTFLFNGGPGSSSIWLHMGAFGPQRVITADATHSAAAPYRRVGNSYSLLDVSDLVFVDAPGTGYSRIAGPDKEKSYFGVDADAHAFAEFILRFLSKYNRWNSPKYLFGESYGTTRAAVLANLLANDYSIDLNGLIFLSQILNFDASIDEAQNNPGIDLPYQLALPSFAATAWYHHKLPEAPKDLEPFLEEVKQFAMGDYGLALAAGSSLPKSKRDEIVAKLHRYTSLPPAYIEKADLRINGGEFEKALQDNDEITTGRLDTRFSGPTLDPLSKEADYDPQAAAISSAYTSAFNDYTRTILKYTPDHPYKVAIDIDKDWDYQHAPPSSTRPLPQAANVMPDLAQALKYNPQLKIQLNAGYFDLATPFFASVHEMQHLPMPPSLQANIEYHFYPSGHMVYANEPSLKALHDNVASFIRRTDNLAQ